MNQKLAKAYADFSLGLMRAVRSSEAENTFLSPASISTVLSMLYAGAAGDTASEMSSVMFGNCEESAVHEGFGSFLSDLSSKQKTYALDVANRIYSKVGFEPEAKFVKQLTYLYNSTIRQVDFEAQSESVRKEINEWVSEVTRGKINELLQSGAVMLPYSSEDVSMLAILPRKRFGLEEVIQSLTGERLMKSAVMCRDEDVEVYIPKFKMEQSFELNDSLQKLGMGKIFGGDADFTGITNTENLVVSKVVHKAFVEVNEEGSEAAAATAVVMMRCSAIVGPPEKKNIFKADQPFLFFIWSNKHNLPLFSGVYNRPAN